jgi:hypothetical protein
MKFTLVLKFVVELFDFSMVSAEKYIRGTAVRWLLMVSAVRWVRAKELVNLEN